MTYPVTEALTIDLQELHARSQGLSSLPHLVVGTETLGTRLQELVHFTKTVYCQHCRFDNTIFIQYFIKDGMNLNAPVHKVRN